MALLITYTTQKSSNAVQLSVYTSAHSIAAVFVFFCEQTANSLDMGDTAARDMYPHDIIIIYLLIYPISHTYLPLSRLTTYEKDQDDNNQADPIP